MVEEVKQRSDQFLLNLDAMFNATLKSLEHNIQGYRSSLQEQLDQMQEAERRGEMLLQALVDRMGSEVQNLPPQARAISKTTETQDQGIESGDRDAAITTSEAEDFSDLDFDEATINSLLTSPPASIESNLVNFPLNRSNGVSASAENHANDANDLSDLNALNALTDSLADNLINDFTETTETVETEPSQDYDLNLDLDRALEDLNIGLNTLDALNTLDPADASSTEPELAATIAPIEPEIAPETVDLGNIDNILDAAQISFDQYATDRPEPAELTSAAIDDNNSVASSDIGGADADTTGTLDLAVDLDTLDTLNNLDNLNTEDSYSYVDSVDSVDLDTSELDQELAQIAATSIEPTADTLTPPPSSVDLSLENLDNLIDNFYNRSLRANQSNTDFAVDADNSVETIATPGVDSDLDTSNVQDRQANEPESPESSIAADFNATDLNPSVATVDSDLDEDDDSFGEFIQDLQSSSIDSTANTETIEQPDLAESPLPYAAIDVTSGVDGADIDTEIAEPPILASQSSPQDFDPDAETQIAAFAEAIESDQAEQDDRPQAETDSEIATETEADDLMAWLESSADQLQASVSPSTSSDSDIDSTDNPDRTGITSSLQADAPLTSSSASDLLDEDPELLAWLEQREQPESLSSTDPVASEAKFDQDFGSKFGISEPLQEQSGQPEQELGQADRLDRQDPIAADLDFDNEISNISNISDATIPSNDQDFMSWLNSDDNSDRLNAEQMLAPEPIEAAINLTDITDSEDPDADAESTNAKLAYLEAEDDVDQSEESLILLPDEDLPTAETSLVEDETLLADLDEDLESLDIGTGVNPIVAANLDLAIRNTPFPGKETAEDDAIAGAQPDSDQNLTDSAAHLNYSEQFASADATSAPFSDRQTTPPEQDDQDHNAPNWQDSQDLFAESAFANDPNQSFSASSLLSQDEQTIDELDSGSSSVNEDLFSEIPSIIDDAASLFEQPQTSAQFGENMLSSTQTEPADRFDSGFDLGFGADDSGFDTGFDTGFGNNSEDSEGIPQIIDDSGALFGFSNSNIASDREPQATDSDSFPDHLAALESLEISGNIDDRPGDDWLGLSDLDAELDLDAEVPLPTFNNSASSDSNANIDDFSLTQNASSLLPELPDLEAQLEQDLRLEWQRSIQDQSDFSDFPERGDRYDEEQSQSLGDDENDNEFDLFADTGAPQSSSSTSDAVEDLGKELDELVKDINVDVDRELDTILQGIDGIDVDTDMDTVLEGLLEVDAQQDAATILNELTAEWLTNQETEIEVSQSAEVTGVNDYALDAAQPTRDFYETLEDEGDEGDELDDQDQRLNQFADDQALPTAEAVTPTDDLADSSPEPDAIAEPEYEISAAEAYLNAELDALAAMEEEEPEDEADFLSEAEIKLTELADREAEDYTWQGFSPADAEIAEPDQDPAWNAAIFNLPDFQIEQELNAAEADLRFNPPDADAAFDRADSFLDVEAVEVEPDPVESQLNLILQPIGNPPPPSDASASDTWFLGIDFGSAHLSASLVNANTGNIYPLSFGDLDDAVTAIPCVGLFNADAEATDPIEAEIAVGMREFANSEPAYINHFKHLLKLGLPYRGISSWQPIVQYTKSQRITLRWIQATLKQLLVKLKTEAVHAQLANLDEIMPNLNGVILGHPTGWTDTYGLNLREAVLSAGLVDAAEKVMVVDRAIAPLLVRIHTQANLSPATLVIDAGATATSLFLARSSGGKTHRSFINSLGLDYAGIALNQDIVTQLLYPHWQLIANAEQVDVVDFNLAQLTLPEPGDPAPKHRALLQQYLLSSAIGRELLNAAEQLKLAFAIDKELEEWSTEVQDLPLTALRRELENQVLQPYIQLINRNLNSLLSNSGVAATDVRSAWLIGDTTLLPSLNRWLIQKLPNAQIERLAKHTNADGLALMPLYRHLIDISRQQYSDYFLLQEICKLNLRSAISHNRLIQQLQARGVNANACRDRIMNILQGELPAGLFPWQEPEKDTILNDPTLSPELFTGQLFEFETDGTYQPNLQKLQLLNSYLQSILANMHQTLAEPLVFPEFVAREYA
jgi:hypothetical protein